VRHVIIAYYFSTIDYIRFLIPEYAGGLFDKTCSNQRVSNDQYAIHFRCKIMAWIYHGDMDVHRYIVLGTVLYFYRVTYKKVYLVLPPRFSLDHLYHQMLEKADNVAKSMTNFYMTDKVRHYFAYIFICFIVLMRVSLFSFIAFSVSFQQAQQMTIFTWIIASSVVIASVTILLTTSRLTAILLNGYVGFSIALFFVIFHAPDLALTQLVIETVTTTLFLLCFY